ncbi:hypothetical protein [Desulfonema magnum]|uniref:Uncharacterized protein n=1 Tax=Desulfonema magnum TaxID=45655 RepID=A0A975BQQ3_9BACT|nr:hypothetical protein [Desulfonema magnum]QTA89947.1 Uncharacterized protein dnm_060060 [Desulfonema magnum]
MKTVELIVEETEWNPGNCIPGDTIAGIRVRPEETQLQSKIKKAGGKWDREKGLWGIRYDKVLEPGIEERMMKDEDMRNLR